MVSGSFSPYNRFNTHSNLKTFLTSKWLFMSPLEWSISIGISMLTAILFLPWYWHISPWIGVGLTLTILALINMGVSSRYMLPYPQLALLIGCLQLILAAWGNHYYPMPISKYNLGERLPAYLSYIVPACILYGVGLTAGFGFIWLIAHKYKVLSGPPVATRKLAKELNAIFILGIAAAFFQKIVPNSLSFVMVLLSNLVFVGAFGYMLLNIPGWKFRSIVAMALLFMKSLNAAMFHDLVVWSASFVLVLSFSRQWSRKRIFSTIIVGAIVVMLIINVKSEYRKQFWYGETQIADNRLVAFSSLIVNILSSPEELFSSDKISFTLTRLNQGWIVNQAMKITPLWKPYAWGDTIVKNIRGALLPRFLYPEKSEVGGRKDYETYTAMELGPGTSMALGYAGEMYVNFGPRWGVIGVGIYGLLIGMGFYWFYIKALRQPLWWAWATYFACIAIRAESSIGYMANWILKAAIVMVAILFIFPELRRVLAPKMPGIDIEL